MVSQGKKVGVGRGYTLLYSLDLLPQKYTHVALVTKKKKLNAYLLFLDEKTKEEYSVKLLKESEHITLCCLEFNLLKLLFMKTKIKEVAPLTVTFRIKRKDPPFSCSGIRKCNSKMLLNQVSIITKKYALISHYL